MRMRDDGYAGGARKDGAACGTLPAEGAAGRVLIVEDNGLNRALFREFLRIEGYGVLEAGSAEDALVLAARERPDLVLTDLQLPGLSGLELARALKAAPELAPIPVLMVSAVSAPGSARAARRAGCAGFLLKPVAREALVAEVGALIVALRAGSRQGERRAAHAAAAAGTAAAERKG